MAEGGSATTGIGGAPRRRGRRLPALLAAWALALGAGSGGLAAGSLELREAAHSESSPSILEDQEHFAQVPLPLALLVGLSLVCLWESVHPRTSQRGSSILRQVCRAVSKDNERELERRATKHHLAAAALRDTMSESSHLVTNRCLTRAGSVFVPRHMEDLESPDRVRAETTNAAGSIPMEAGGEAWLEAEAGTGPLASRPMAHGSVVFFAEHTVTVEATQADATLVLFRVGHLSHALSVTWSTLDGTALAGVDYERATGVARFEAGEKRAELRVKLVEAERFCCTQRFFLVHVESIAGRGSMGSLPFARVRVNDAGVWPPGLDVKALASDEECERSYLARFFSATRLVMAFVRMLVRWRGRWYWRIVGCCVWKDFHKVVLNALLLNFALYDLCLTRADDPAAYRRLPAVAGLKLLFVLADRLADHVETNESGAVGSARLLQGQVLHKYMEMRSDPVDLGSFYHLFFETVPECVEFAYKPTFRMIRSTITLVFSFLMALALPLLKGSSLRGPAAVLSTLRPLFGIAVLVPMTFMLALPMRRQRLKALVAKRRDSHVEACESLQDVLACRQGVRAFDGAYPSQQVRSTFDRAYKGYGGHRAAYAEYKNDTQWVAQYLGELAKILAMMYGGYSVLHNARTGSGGMTLGQFAVIVSLYGSTVGALYDFVEAWDGFSYAHMLLRELRDFLSHSNNWSVSLPSDDVVSQEGWLAIKLDSVHLDMHAEGGLLPRPLPGQELATSEESGGVSTEIPLGCIYAVAASEGWSGTRRHVGALLGGATCPCKGTVAMPSFVRPLLVSPPASLAAGSLLENLMSYAAAWVRGSDALALAAALCIPFEAPSRHRPLHDLQPSKLLEALSAAVAASGETLPVFGRPQLRRLPAADAAQEEPLAKAAASFRARMAGAGVDVLTAMEKVEPLLRTHEMQVMDLARGLLADPDVLVVQDTLLTLPAFHAKGVLRVLQAWQRLGGLKGMVCAWEKVRQEGEDRDWLAKTLSPKITPSVPDEPPMQEFDEHQPAHGEYPPWLTKAGGLCRTLVLSEPSLVTAGLQLRRCVDSWLVVGSDHLEVVAANGESEGMGL